MIRQAITCDICGSEKKQTNHWFVAYEQGGELRVSGWNSRNQLRAASKHLCGQTCLHKLVDDFMARTLSVRPQLAGSDEADSSQAAVHVPIAVPVAVQSVAQPRITVPAPVHVMAQAASDLPATRPAPAPFISVATGTDTSLTADAAYPDHVLRESSPYENLAYDEFESSARLIPSPSPEPSRSKRPLLVDSPEPEPLARNLVVEEPVEIPVEPPSFSSRNWRAEAWERERDRELRAAERRPDSGTTRRRPKGLSLRRGL